MTIRTDFSDSFPEQEFGKITGTYLLSRFPNIPARLARFKGYSDNISPIWVGSPRATGMFPMPWPINPGDDTGWFAVPLDVNSQGNLNNFYQNASSGSSYIAYWVQR